MSEITTRRVRLLHGPFAYLTVDDGVGRHDFRDAFESVAFADEDEVRRAIRALQALLPVVDQLASLADRYTPPKAEYEPGQKVWLYPDKSKPSLRHLCRIMCVKRFCSTVLYDTDWEKPGGHRAVGISGHWLRPVSVIIQLADLARG